MMPHWIRLLPPALRARLEGRSTLLGIIDNTGWLVADRVVRGGIGILIGIWLGRYLGPEQFGIYSYAIAYLALFSGIATLGLDGMAVRDLVREPERKDEIIASAFVLKLLSAATMFFVVWLTISLLRPDDAVVRSFVLISAGGVIFQAFDAIDFGFQAQVKSRYSVIARNAAFIVVAAVKIGLILQHAPLIAFAWAGSAELLLGAIALLVMYRASGDRLLVRLARTSRLSSLLRDSLPIFISSIAIMVYMRVDQVMLGEMASFKEVANYAVAVRLIEVWYLLPVALTASLYPAVIRSRHLHPEVYMGRIQSLFDLLVWMGIAIAVFSSVFSADIVRLSFGTQYLEAGRVLNLQAWASVVVFFGLARSRWLFAENQAKHGTYVDLTALVLSVCANYLLIPRHGAIGAAIASLIAGFGANLLVAIFSKPIRHSVAMYGKSLLLPLRMYQRKSFWPKHG